MFSRRFAPLFHGVRITEPYKHRMRSAAAERLSVIDSDGFTEMQPPRSRFQLPLNLGTPSTRNNFFVHKSSVLVPAPSSLCTFHPPPRLIHFFFLLFILNGCSQRIPHYVFNFFFISLLYTYLHLISPSPPSRLLALLISFSLPLGKHLSVRHELLR